LVGKGADVHGRQNARGRTALEEVRGLLDGGAAGNAQLEAVAQYLAERQENENSPGAAAGSLESDSESSDFDDGEDDAEFNRLLGGLANSPGVDQALQALQAASEAAASAEKKASGRKKTKPRSLFRMEAKEGKDKASTSTEAAATTTAEVSSTAPAATTTTTTATDATSPTTTSTSATAASKESQEEANPKEATAKTEDLTAKAEPSESEAKVDQAEAAAEPSEEAAKSPVEEKAAASGAGEKRSAPEEDSEEVEVKSKKRKEEPAQKEAAKPGRSSRGNSTEKSVPASSTNSAAKSKAKSGTSSSDRRSPVSQSNSAANSPRPKANVEEVEGEEKSEGPGPKVPPLKIVLSGSSGSGSGGASPANSDVDAKLPLSKEVAGSQQEADAAAASVKEEEEKSDDQAKEDAAESGRSGSRMTRSRANQGTPGPEGADGGAAGGGNHTDSGSSSADQSAPAASAKEEKGGNGYTEYHVKKRKLRTAAEASSSNATSAGPSTSRAGGNGNTSTSAASAAGVTNTPTGREVLNDIQKFLAIRKQVEQRRKNLYPVHPKPPQGYRDYLMNRKTYLLQDNAAERLRSMPMIQPPPSLAAGSAMRELFVEQEKARYQLRKRHVVEKEKLVLTVEQEIIRVHGRAARALSNQPFPYSVCTVLRDEEIYTPIQAREEEKNRDIRSRYSGRLFLSWLQDVDDKWEKIKEQMVLRHHNEAESLNAVQKMDWEWKLAELSNAPAASDANGHFQVDDLYVPMVHVSDDFDLMDSR